MVGRNWAPLRLHSTARGAARRALAFAAAALALLLGLPALASATHFASSPESPYETRGKDPVAVSVTSSVPSTYVVTSGPDGGTLSNFAGNGTTQGSWTYTADDGFAGLDSFNVEVFSGDSEDIPPPEVEVEVVVRPTTVLLTGPGVDAAALTNDDTPTFTYKAVTGDADVTAPTTYRCRVDTGSFVGCNSGSFTTAALDQGSHTVTVRAATDGGLNVDPEPATASFTVDTVPPAVEFTSGPEGTIGPNRASFTAEASDLHGPLTSECRLIEPGGDPDPAFGACLEDYTGLGEGEHTLELKVTDAAGNSTTISRTFTVENNTPVAADEERSTEGVDPVDVAATDADDDPLAYTVTTEPEHGTVSTLDDGAGLRYVADSDFAGVDEFSYEVWDGRPNGADAATVTITVTPQTVITEDPGPTTGVGRPAWSFTSTQTTEFECQLALSEDYDEENGEWLECNGGSFQPDENLADGDYTFGVRAVSGAFVDPTPATHDVTVENTGPGIGPLSFDTEGTDPVDVTVGPEEDADGDDLTYELVAGPTLGSLDDETDVREFVYTADADKAGVETIVVSVDDGRGTPEQVEITIDVAPPTEIETAPEDRDNDSTPTWTFSSPVTEAGFECRIDGGGWVACDDGSFTPGEPLADGLRTFEVRATKGGVADPTPASDTTVVDTTAPAVTFDPKPEDGNTIARPDIGWDSPDSDLDPDSYECRLYAADTDENDLPDFETCTSPVQLPFLDRNTEYVFDVRVTDDLGNTAVRSHSWEQANTPPATPPVDASVEGGEHVEIDLTDTVPTVDDDGDDVTFESVTEPEHGTLDSEDLENGLLTYSVDEDFAGEDSFDYTVSDGREGGTASGTVTITVTPQTQIDTRPPAETNDATPEWTFGSPVEGAGFECRIDDGDWESCDDGSFSPADDLAEGEHVFQVRATFDGLTDPTPAEDATIVDLTAPDVSITDTPAALSNDRTPSFEFESDDASANFECRVDDDSFEECESGDSTASLDDGEHTFQVRAVDPATNRTDPPAEHTWDLDATAPAITRTSGPADGGFSKDKKPIWEWELSDATEAHPSGHVTSASERCRVDSQPWTQPCPALWQQPSNLSDGPHTLRIEADDDAGNTGELVIGFTVDTIAPPQVHVTDGPDGLSGPSASFEFVSDEEDSTFQCRLVRSPSTVVEDWTACESGKTYSSLASGGHTFRVKASDRAGNESPTASHTWTVVAGAPDTTITSGPGGTTTSRSATFAFASGDADAFQCRVDGGSFSACTSPLTLGGLSLGAHTFEVRAVNAVGTPDPSPASRAWTIVDAPAGDGGGGAGGGGGGGGGGTGGPGGDPGTPPCEDIPANSVTTAKVKIARGVFARLRLSHGEVRAGQEVAASVLLNGKGSAAARRKALKKAIRSIAIADGGEEIASLEAPRWSAEFAPESTGERKLTVEFDRKRGKTIERSLDLAVESACA